MIYLTPFNVPKEEYEGLIARREYWDDGGDEYTKGTFCVLVLVFLCFYNKKGEFSLVLCSLIRIFSPCEKILTPKGMSVAMQSLARKRK